MAENRERGWSSMAGGFRGSVTPKGGIGGAVRCWVGGRARHEGRRWRGAVFGGVAGWRGRYLGGWRGLFSTGASYC